VRSYARVLWRRKWILLASVVVLPVAVYFIASSFPDVYKASTIVQIQPQGTDTSAQQALAASQRITTTSGVAERAARTLGLPASEAGDLAGEVSTSTDRAAGFLTISAEDENPQRAANIANAFASSLAAARSAQAKSQIDTSISQLEQNLRDTPASDQESRRQLSRQIQQLRGQRAAQYAQVIQRAGPPTSPVSPRPLRDAAIALVIGGLIGVGLAFMLESFDRRLRDPTELEALAAAPLLGVIPESAFTENSAAPEVTQAFQMVGARLTYFSHDPDQQSVLVASPLKGDGKTTVAKSLAHAMAGAGKDVILLDADLRDPQLGFEGDSHAAKGLGDVLLGEEEVEAVIEEVETKRGRLRVIPGGPPNSDPSELFTARRLETLLASLGSRADLVIIDSAPALLVGDAIPLAQHVSGVLLVSRIGWTTREAVSRFATVMQNADGHLVGVVATGSASSGSRYGYGYDAAAMTGRRSRLPFSLGKRRRSA
jgi:tyrosine-protein kinase